MNGMQKENQLVQPNDNHQTETEFINKMFIKPFE